MADELRWNLRGRPGWLAGIGFNFVLACTYLAYYRSTSHFPDRGLSYIGASIAAWLLADTLTTNQFGAQGEAVATALDGKVGIGRLLLVKNLGLATLLLMITLPVTVAATAWVGRWGQLHDAVLVDLHVVLVWLGLGNIVSVLLPYRPIPFHKRWQLRHIPGSGGACASPSPMGSTSPSARCRFRCGCWRTGGAAPTPRSTPSPAWFWASGTGWSAP